MTNNRRQSLATLTEQLRTCERLLRRGATVPAVAEAVGVSDKQIRRYIATLRELGVEVTRTDDPFGPSTFKVARGSRLFR